MALQSLNPRCGCGHFLKIEEAGVQQVVEIHVTVVTLDNAGVGLQVGDDRTDAAQILLAHLADLVQNNHVTELDLLNHQIFNILFVDIGLEQVVAAGKLVLHAQRIHYGSDAVQLGHTALGVLRTHCGNGANGLGNGSRLADAAGLNHNVIKLTRGDDVVKLLNQVHLQRTANAAVLQRHQRVVRLIDHAVFLDEGSVYVDFTDVVHDDGKADAAPVVENTVEKGRLTTAEITREKQYRNFFHCQ